jgi:hypothetical protein
LRWFPYVLTIASIFCLAVLSASSTFPLVSAVDTADCKANVTWGYLGVTGRGIAPRNTSLTLLHKGLLGPNLFLFEHSGSGVAEAKLSGEAELSLR